MESLRSLSQLGASIDRSVENGYMGHSESFVSESLDSTRARAAGRYLFLLDYIDRPPPEELPDNEKKRRAWRTAIHDGIRAFQQEADLTVTGDLDSTTWASLLELGSFDTPTYVSSWMRNGDPLPVLVRAAKCRLYAFGLCDRLPKSPSGVKSKDREQANDLERGIDGFVRVARLLKLANDQLDPALDLAFLSTLFDQTELIHRLSSGTDDIEIHGLEGLTARQQRKASRFAREFAGALAAVEMWLFGYDVKVGSGRDRERIIVGEGRLSLDSAAEEFMETHAGVTRFPGIRKKHVPAILFRTIREVRIQADSMGETGTDADAIVDQVLETPGAKAQVIQRIRSFATRLWDGVKRVWRWFRTGIRRLFEKTKRVAKSIISNIARFVHKSASGLYERVRLAVRALKDGYDFMRRKVVRGSDLDHIVVNHDRDFDLLVYINPTAEPGYVENLSDRLLLRARVFSIAATIVGELFEIFLEVVRRGVTMGWFGLLLAMTKLGQSLVRLNRLTKNELDVLDRLDELERRGALAV